ncbi:MAG: DUF11 domain-containing protein [Chloroflexi bacterium]|nr:DUF11 domain-containing protein [Chloroflexota bacterium]
MLSFLIPSLVFASLPVGFQEYYVLGYEEHVWRAFREINDGSDPTNLQDGKICSTVNLVATADYQIVYYDHWEDGYEPNLLSPIQPTTEVYGDNDPSNGGSASDVLTTGDAINLTSNQDITGTTDLTGYVSVYPARDRNDLRYDGGDRIITSGGPINLTHAMWPLDTSWIGGAWEVYSRQAYADSYSYRLPVGENLYDLNGGDTGPFGDFRNVYLQLGAFEDNTTVSISNDTGTINLTLDRGQTYFSKGYINSTSAPTITIDAGTVIHTNKPSQVGLITGADGSFQGRFLIILPDRQWGADYVVPIPRGYGRGNDDDRIDAPSEVYLSNPNNFPIEIHAYDITTQTSFIISPTPYISATVAYSQVRGGSYIPQNSAARFTSDDGVFGVVVCADTSHIDYDWGFSGTPSKYLTRDYYVSWAPGDDNIPPINNGSPVWVTPMADNTTFFVDFNRNPGGLDNIVDEIFTLDVLEQQRIFDTDNDNTGMHIWATDEFAVAWGEDPQSADSANPYLDLGVAMLPLQQRWLDPVLTLDKTANPTILPSTGGTVTFTLVAKTHNTPLINVDITDTLPINWTYVPSSTHITYPEGNTELANPIIDDQTLFWDISTSMGFHQILTITFQAQIIDTGSVDVSIYEGFENINYSGGANWTGGWQEEGDDDNPVTGAIHITSLDSPLAGPFHLRFQDNIITNTYAISRSVDLSNFTTPVLHFLRQVRSLESGDYFYLDIYNGVDWTTALVWTNGSQEFTTIGEAVDLSPYADAASAIRFRSDDVFDEAVLFIDQIKIREGIAISLNQGEAIGRDEYSDTIFNPTAEAIVHISPLNLSKSVSSEDAGIGDTLVYTLSFVNLGDSSATNVTVHDAVPAQYITFQSISDGGTYNGDSGIVILTDTLAPGNSDTVTFTVTVNDFVENGTIIENTAYIESDQTIKAGSNIVRTTILAPDIQFTKLGPTVVYPGNEITYTLSYRNVGGAPATGVTIQDTVPLSSTYISGSLSIITGTKWIKLTDNGDIDQGTYISPTLIISPGINPGIVEAGETGQIRFGVQLDANVPLGSLVQNWATLNRHLDNPNDSNLVITRISDLLINKKAEPTMALLGDTITYTVVYTNVSTTRSQTQVYVRESIPEYTHFITVTESAGNQVEYSWDNGTAWESTPFITPVTHIRWLDTQVPTNTQVALGFTVQVLDTLPPQTTIESTAYITSEHTAEHLRGWIPSNLVQVKTVDLWVEKSVNQHTSPTNVPISYTISYGNRGSADVSVQLLDTIPENTNYITDSIWGTGSDTDQMPTLLWNVGPFAAGSSTQKVGYAIVPDNDLLPGTIITNVVVLSSAFGLESSNPVTVSLVDNPILTVTKVPNSDFSWWDFGYRYRQQITVTAGSTEVPNKYTASTIFDHAALVAAGKSLTDGNDVRIVHWNGDNWIELDRVLDPVSDWNAATTQIWFPLVTTITVSSSDNGYYLFYGNNLATSPPDNWQAVFMVGDNFDDGLLTSDFVTSTTGTASITETIVGEAFIDLGTVPTDAGIIAMADPLPSDRHFAIRHKVKLIRGGNLITITAPAEVKHIGIVESPNQPTVVINTTENPRRRIISYQRVDKAPFIFYTNIISNDINWNGTVWQSGDVSWGTALTDTYYIHDFISDGTNWHIAISDASGTPITTTTPIAWTDVFNGGNPLWFYWGEVYTSHYWADVKSDWIYMRKYIDPEPTTILSSEEDVAAVAHPAIVGAPYSYFITVTNSSGPADATDVIVTDTLPSGAHYISGGSYISSSNSVRWIIPTIPPSGAQQITFAVSTCQFSLLNAAYRVITSTQMVDSPLGPPLLTPFISPTVNADFTTYTLNSVFYFTSTSMTDGGPITDWDWDLGDGNIANGSTISHAYFDPGNYTVTLTVTDTCGYTDTTTKTLSVYAPVITVVKSAEPPIVTTNELLTYTISVSNTGRGYATRVLVSDTLPANTQFVANSIILNPPDAGIPGTVLPILASGVTITPGHSITVTFAVTVNASSLDNTTITNTVFVTSTQIPTPTTDTVTNTVNVQSGILWLTTNNDVSSSGAPGLDSWTNGQIIEFGGPNLTFDPAGTPPNTTNGTFSSILNIDDFAQDGDANVQAIHYVSRDITIGGSTASIDLFTGDLLLATNDDETLSSSNSLMVTRQDVFVFRPDTLRDYTSGTFVMLLDNAAESNIHTISLVEKDTVVGDTTLPSGAFLLSHSGPLVHDEILVFNADGVGAGIMTTGTITTLIKGNDIRFLNAQVQGLDLVEESTTIGGTLLNAGNILVTINHERTVGNNDISVMRQDIFYLDVATTSITSTVWADATLIFDGSDVSLDAIEEDLNGLSLIPVTPDVVAEFDSAAYTVSEGDGSATITVTLNRASVSTATVGYVTSNGSAAAGDDYTAASGTLTFIPGTTIQTFTVAITNDENYENPETVHLTLNNPVSTVLGISSAILVITDNDPMPTVEFSSTAYSVDESNGSATITVTLSTASALTSTVDYTTSDGSATAPDDYTATSGTLTFTAGITSQTFTVDIIPDSTAEPDETITLNLSNPHNATIGTNNPVTLTINDDDITPTVGFDRVDYTINESDGSATITVTLSAASALTSTVDYTTSDGSATAPDDYTATSGILTFTAGITSQTFTVDIIPDSTAEPDETITLNLSNPHNIVVGSNNPAILTINDDDLTTIVDFDRTDYTVDESSGSATITVTLDVASVLTATVDYATSDGSATTPNDYTTTNGTLTFTAGITSQTFIVNIVPDSTAEPDETIILNLSNPQNATIGTNNPITLTISDDDLTPTVDFDRAAYTIDENSGTVIITITLSNPSSLPISVNYQTTTGGTATPGDDYTATSGTLNLEPFSTTQTFTVPITPDPINEPDETVVLILTGASNATVGTAHNPVILTIVDDDGPPIADFSIPAFTVNESASSATVTVSLSHPSNFAITVDYVTFDGTATAGNDYTVISGTLDLTPLAITQTFTVPIIPDQATESDETVVLSLTEATNAVVGTTYNPATLIILDDDDPAIIAGTVFSDSNGNGVRDTGEVGIPNVLITLENTALAAITTTITGASGDYMFTTTITGTYTIIEIDPQTNFAITNAMMDPIYYFSTTPNKVHVNVTTLGRTYPVDFGDALPTSNFASIHGTAFQDIDGDGARDPTELGLSNIIITLNGSITDTTDLYGNYTFFITSTSVHTVAAAKPNGYFYTTPEKVHVKVKWLGKAYPIDFGNAPITSGFATIYGTVFNDIDNDGMQDAIDLGIQNVIITLEKGPTVTTNLYGGYTLSTTVTGMHTITETDLIAYTSTTSNVMTQSVTLDNGYQVDFGDKQTCSDDPHEEDDTIEQARQKERFNVNGQSQAHQFCDDTIDWVRFAAEAYTVYTVTTNSWGEWADTALALFATDVQTQPLAENYDCDWAPNNYGEGSSCIVWEAPSSGDYYVRTTNENGLTTRNTLYNLWIQSGDLFAIYLPIIMRNS